MLIDLGQMWSCSESVGLCGSLTEGHKRGVWEGVGRQSDERRIATVAFAVTVVCLSVIFLLIIQRE